MLVSQSRTLPLFLAGLACAACIPAMSKPILRDQDAARLQPDTKATCLVAAVVWMPAT